jgi:dihydrofolate synthase/folylpolyglutamate synthase
MLGNTIEEIATQKSGIIKQNTKAVIIGRIEPAAKSVIKNRASQLRVHFGEVTDKLKVNRGYYQMYNASLAWTISKLFIYLTRDKNEFNNLIDNHKTNDVIQLLNNIQLPGRMEKVHEHPIIIIDGAHNQQGINTLVDTLLKDYGDKKQHIIFGHLDSHQIDINEFKQLPYAKVYPVSFDSFKPSNQDEENWKDRLNDLINEIDPEKEMIVVTGSFYLVSQVREYLLNPNSNIIK